MHPGVYIWQTWRTIECGGIIIGRKTIVLLIAVAFVGLPGALTGVRNTSKSKRDKGGKQMNRNTAQIGDKYARINGTKWDKGGSYR